jgi:GNAT superfamily N-acetyltransferase
VSSPVRISPATEHDVGIVLALIKELADYEKMTDQVVATEADVRRSLFGVPPEAEALIARVDDQVVGFALFFHNYSTFLGRRGLYLEDLYVRPAARGRGYGRGLLAALARIAVERGCGRMEWAVLDWNELAMKSYRRAGAKPQDEWTVWRLTGKALEDLAQRG